MKNIILTLLLFAFACKAQTSVLPLFDNPDYGQTAGAYYKDTYNSLDPFIGIWEFTSGTVSLKIQLQKKTMAYDSMNNIYEDLLIGEYRYIENGSEKVNTLPLLTSTSNDPYDHNIVGNLILSKQNIPVCTDCLNDEKRVRLYFDDPTRNIPGLGGRIEFKRVDENGVHKIKATLRQTGNIVLVDDQQPEFTSFNVPWGTYVLTKVN